MTEVRALTPEDAAAYLVLRREMLVDSPWAFASSVEDSDFEPETLAAKLHEPGQAIVGGFDGERLVGAAGVYRDRHLKMAHRARVWGMYVTPPARGRGLGEKLLARAFEVARSWPGVDSVGLSVSANAPAALRLYQRLGFAEWGVEPATLVVDDVAYDEIHMVLVLGR